MESYSFIILNNRCSDYLLTYLLRASSRPLLDIGLLQSSPCLPILGRLPPVRASLGRDVIAPPGRGSPPWPLALSRLPFHNPPGPPAIGHSGHVSRPLPLSSSDPLQHICYACLLPYFGVSDSVTQWNPQHSSLYCSLVHSQSLGISPRNCNCFHAVCRDRFSRLLMKKHELLAKKFLSKNFF